MELREGLGYQFLTHQEKKAYKTVLNSFFTSADSFSCSGIDRGVDIMKVIQTALGDNPSVIYFNKTQINIEASLRDRKVLFVGVPAKGQIDKMNSSLDVEARRAAASVKSSLPDGYDEYALLIKLYEYLQANVKYDRQELLANAKGTSPNPASHNACGAIVNKLAVCDGFSAAFALLAHRLGVECMLVIGSSTYDSALLTNHAWNIVKMQNRYCHMDVTWDARRFGEFESYSYVYFAQSDNEAAKDHQWDRKSTPACSGDDLSYYIKNGLYAENIEQLNKVVKSAAESGDGLIRVKLSPKISLGVNIGESLTQMYMNEAAKPGMRVQASYGWNDRTRCFFAKLIQ